MRQRDKLTRRGFLTSLAGAAAALTPALSRGMKVRTGSPDPAPARPGPLITRPIPSSGEKLPLVGLGSWVTFNVGEDVAARDSCAEVMRAFFEEGGRVIDSSPMYGSSQETIGYGLRKLGHPARLFSA